MIHLQPERDQRILCGHHILIVVLRKVRVQPVAGSAGLSVTDAVRQNDEISGRVEQPSFPEQNTAELIRQEIAPRSARAVQDEHRIVDAPMRVAVRLAEHGVVNAQFGQGLSRCETEIWSDVLAFEMP